MKWTIGAVLVLVIVLGLAFATRQITSTQAPPPFYWEFINVDIDVQENGDILITETQKYVFTRPYKNECYRWIPLEKVDGIVSVHVSEEGRELSAARGVEDNQLWIRWRHALNPPESHTFVLKYRVIGGLYIHDDGDQVYWKAFSEKRDAPIHSGNVAIRLPASLAGQILSINSFGVLADARRVDTQTVEFVSRGQIQPGRGLEVQVTFPHGIIAGDIPEWQKASAGDPFSWVIFWAVFGALGLLIFLWAVGGSAYRGYYRKVHGRYPTRQDIPRFIWLLFGEDTLGDGDSGGGDGR